MQSQYFRVEGGRKLKGSLKPQGAKNEALQIICATLLTSERVTIHNIPDIVDVRRLIALVEGMGVKVERIDRNTYIFQADELELDYVFSEDFYRDATKIRGSVMLMGPMLVRFGRAYLPKPGGDKIGRRRLDTHLLGFEMLGASFSYDPSKKAFYLDGSKISGKEILMEEISVTGTANLLMAASMCPGETVIYNAACEPYVQQLCRMLVRMGASIEGIGSNLLKITGVDRLSGTEHNILPDMIEIGSFIGLAALCQSEITIRDAAVNELGIIPSTFRKLGIEIREEQDNLVIPEQEHYQISTFIDGSILTLYDAPWPGFSPDLMSIALVVAIQAQGSVLIHQKMFESRLFFVDKLIEMGAKIILCDPHRATVIGLNRKFPLRGIEMTSPDIRAGVALLLAALSAEGESIIYNINQIDRGYERIDQRLNALGASIERVPA
jgi:UDP-N-acetylglucosamine 1-carboxyvinyltransferase